MAVRVAYGMRSRSCLDVLCRRGGARFLCTPAPAGGVEESHRDPPWVGTWYETLSSSVPVATVESGLIALQVASGLPWWSTVLAATAILRTGLTLPLSVLQKRVVARVSSKRRGCHSAFAERVLLLNRMCSYLRNVTPRRKWDACFLHIYKHINSRI